MLKRWRQAQDSTFRLLSMGYGVWKRKPWSTYVPSSQHPDFKAHCQLSCTRENRKILLKLGKELLLPTSKIPLTRTLRTNAGHV